MKSPPINPEFPLTAPSSIDEIMAMAFGIEQEAARRYRELCRRMETSGDEDLAAVFRNLAALEENHERSLAQWARREGGEEVLASQFAWALPETFPDEQGEPLTGYRALAIAVRNEEKAFAFYRHLAAMVDLSPELRHVAEALARDELGHIASLRVMRRQAFHTIGRGPAYPKIADMEAFRRFAWGVESGAALLCRHLRDRAAEAAAGLPLIERICSESERRVARLAGPSAGEEIAPGSRVFELARRRGAAFLADMPLARMIDLCERDAQDILDAYLSIAETAADQKVLRAAQRLAEATMARLAALRSMVSPET